MGTQREVEISPTLSLTPALDWGKWLTSLPGLFTPRERPGTHRIGRWEDLKADLKVCRKFSPIGIRSQDRQIRSQSVPTKLSWPTDGKSKGKAIPLQG